MKVTILGGLYEGLGLASALLLAKEGHSIKIVHKKVTSRPLAAVDNLKCELDKVVDKNRLDLQLLRYDTEIELCEIFRLDAEVTDAVIICEGQRAYDFKNIEDISYLDLEKAIKNEISSILSFTQIVLPIWRKRKRGTLISFGYYQDYWDNHLPFHSGHKYGNDSHLFRIAKSVKKNLFREYADKYILHGIKFNLVNPGRVKNLNIDMLEKVIFQEYELKNTQATSYHIGKLIKFLVSDDSMFISGSEIPLLNFPIIWKKEND